MEGDWTQAIIMLAAIFGVFLWLRNDIRDNRREINRLRDDMNSDMKQLRDDLKGDMKQQSDDLKSDMKQFRAEMQGDFQRLETKVDGLDSRLRAVESEQSRVVGLLEGLGLAGTLPGKDS